jgi:TonB-linked SusC/RagA family outer membrane protein
LFNQQKFTRMKKSVLYLFMLLLIVVQAAAQEPQVTGLVTGRVASADGSALPRVTILQKGTHRGTVTNALGEYKIMLPGDAILQFSFVGFKTLEIAVEGRERVDVAMEEIAQKIDEVIVVAYGTAKRESFTGSVSTIKHESLAARQVSNVTSALSGQLAGVQVRSGNGQPGVSASVRIRGIGSLAAGNAPLYVVDGIPYDGDISSINNADIESLTVLKDAASNALYGARGANGVILITTKKAKTRDAVIAVDLRWGNNSRAVPNYDVIKNPATYMEKVYEAIYNGFASSMTPEEAHKTALSRLATNKDGGVGYQLYALPPGEELIGADGKLNPAAELGYTDGEFAYLPDDWFAELFNRSNLRQEYNVSVSGSSDKLNYYLSLGYLDDSGLMQGSAFSRYSSRANIDYQAKPWLKLTNKLSFARYDMGYPPEQTSGGSSINLFYVVNNIAPIYPMYVRDAEGNILKDRRGFTVYDFGDQTSSNFTRTFMSGSNPGSLYQFDKRAYLADVFGGRWSAALRLADGLLFTYSLGADVDNTRYSRLYNAYYGQYSKVGGVVQVRHYRTTSLNHQQLLAYSLAVEDHSVNLLLGHESYSLLSQNLQGSMEKLYDPEIVEISNAILSPSASSSSNRYKTEGWFARAQYEFDNAYVFSASYRRDASSRFHRDQRWGNFGSVGAAWLISRESFLATASHFLDLLKIKASYGVQGNDDLLYQGGGSNYYPDRDQYSVSEYNGDFALSLEYKGNKEITWETSNSFNVGAEFSLWNNKLAGTVEYFSRLTRDMLYYRPVALSGGYSVFPSNIGKVSNRGLELSLASTLHAGANTKFSLYANATFLANKIRQLAPELDGKLIDGTTILQEGKSMYQLYLPVYEGVDHEGRALYKLDSPTGPTTTRQQSLATRYATGDLLPDIYGGFGVTVMTHGLDFSFSAAYQLGGRIFDSGYRAFMHQGSVANAGHNWHKDILNSWSPERPDSNIPRVGANDTDVNASSTRFLIKSDFLDITHVAVGYTLPPSLFGDHQVTELRVYCAVDNLLLLSARRGLDPRQGFTSANANGYSPIRSLSGGVSLKF